MNHGSLFSGIGGFDLASEWMGWNNSFHCEWNDFAKKVLNYYWPSAVSYGDITKTDFSIWRGRIDILTGGFPCQPYSVAGKRKGKEDERHLWPEMLRAIREIEPRYVVGENVSGIISWDGGLVFNEVQADLENQGYEILPFILPACAVNAPHRRDRVWFIAYRNSSGLQTERPEQQAAGIEQYGELDRITSDSKSNGNRGGLQRLESKDGGKRKSEEYWQNNNEFRDNGEERNVTNANSKRNQRQPTNIGASEKVRQGRESDEEVGNFGDIRGWETFPTQSPICSGDDGLPTELDGITFSKWRSESIKGYGNAIVPQVALQIFKAIQQLDNEFVKLSNKD